MNEQKIKVALICASTAPIPDVLGGGAERLVTMLLDENEFEQKLEFLVFSKYDKKAKEMSKSYKHSRIVYFVPSTFGDKIRNLFIYTLNKIFGKTIIPFGYYKKIASYLKDNKVDIMVDENGYVKDYKVISDTIGVNRSVAHIHWKVNPKERHIEHNYRYAMGVSEYITNYWLKNSCEGVIDATVSSGINEHRFQKEISEEEKKQLMDMIGIQKGSLVISYCGRIHEQKGPLELYRAFKNLGLKESDVTLLFIGGSDKEGSKISAYHKELLQETSNDKNVFFTGYVNNDVLYKYYQISDVLVIPTIVEEAAGLVAIEAMMSGLPIIATKSGGLPEYVNEKCAILINKDGRMQAELSNALRELIENREKREQMAIEAKIQSENYTQSGYYNRFVKKINLIMQEQRSDNSV